MHQSIRNYRNQPFQILYVPTDIVMNGGGLKTKDGKYHTKTDTGGYSYWYGTGENTCYPNTAYGYFFICSPDLHERAAENLNKTLSDTYEFNPTKF